MKHIQVAMRSSTRFSEQWQLLPNPQKRLLQSLVFDYRERFVFDDILTRAAYAAHDGGSRKAAPTLINEFKMRGWLFQGKAGGQAQLFYMPQDMRALYVRFIGEHLRAHFQVFTEPHSYREEKQWMLEDLRTFLQFVGDRGLDLTQSGAIQKKWLTQYMRQCNAPESLQLEGFRFGYGRSHREYPGRFSLLYDFCCAQQWVEESEGRLVLTDQGRDLVAGATSQFIHGEKMQLLLRFWFRSYRRAVPNIAALIRMIVRTCVDWTSSDSLVEALRIFVKPYYYDDADQVLTLRILPMMVSFGLLRTGSNSEGEWLLQATEECAAMLSLQKVELQKAVVKRLSM
jgi:hypothetical protein